MKLSSKIKIKKVEPKKEIKKQILMAEVEELDNNLFARNKHLIQFIIFFKNQA